MNFVIKNSKIVLYIAFGVSLLLVALLVFLSYDLTKQHNKTENRVIRSYQILTEGERLYSYLKDAHRSHHTYLLTQDTSFLTFYLQVQPQMIKSLQTLSTLTADQPLMQKQLAVIRNHIQISLNQWTKNRELADRQVMKSVIGVGKRGRDQQEKDRIMVELIGRELNALQKQEQQLLISREAALDTARERHSILTLIIGCVVFLLLLLLWKLLQVKLRLQDTFNHILEKKVEERTLELQYLNEQLQKANQQIKSSEEEIRQRIEQVEIKKQRFELALLGGNLGMWDWNLVSGQVIYNQREADMLGFSLAEIQSSPSHKLDSRKENNDWITWIHPSDAPWVLDQLELHLKGSIPLFQVEHRLQRKDQQWIWVISSGKVLAWNENKRPARIVGTHLDITDQKEAENKTRFQAHLLELIDIGIISLTQSLQIRSWSNGAQAIFGLTSEQTVGKQLSEVLTIKPKDNSSINTLYENLNQRQTWKGEVLIFTPDEQTHSIFLTFSRFTDLDEDEGYMLVCKDIEEIATIQHQLKEHQSYILSAIENSADSIFGLNARFELLFYNTAYIESWRQNWGWDVHLGDDISLMISEQGRKVLIENWARVQQGEKFSYEYQYTYPTSETEEDKNRTLYFEVSVHPIYGMEQEVIGISYLYRDITEKIRVRKQIEQMQTELLSNKLKEQWVQANALIEGQELERKRLARELHDGLGQMLNVLKMQLVQQMVPLDSRLMLDQILSELSAMNNNLMPLVLQDFGLHAGIRQLIEQYQKVTGIEIYYFSDLEGTRFGSNLEVSVYRMIQEALSNAAKYAKASHISVQITHTNTNLLLMVEDDGIGFDPQKTLLSDRKGFGLLNMRFRVETLKGRIFIESQTGRGCLINIEVPLSTHFI
ncbi:PAS domain-containing protein [Xanthocytophaga agilis]|uniref:histidine kinase n=1 Tax=Xanthocytophaga agilis TaxID=3048010 RepID=A0AAE3R9R5_9BACT|nr:PAS domain-containing protein [Xanthocytophaga agilis]MDJ1505850.1 PAS domain S-box protein [Xanthocytophaga agilis]